MQTCYICNERGIESLCIVCTKFTCNNCYSDHSEPGCEIENVPDYFFDQVKTKRGKLEDHLETCHKWLAKLKGALINAKSKQAQQTISEDMKISEKFLAETNEAMKTLDVIDERLKETNIDFTGILDDLIKIKECIDPPEPKFDFDSIGTEGNKDSESLEAAEDPQKEIKRLKEMIAALKQQNEDLKAEVVQLRKSKSGSKQEASKTEEDKEQGMYKY